MGVQRRKTPTETVQWLLTPKDSNYWMDPNAVQATAMAKKAHAHEILREVHPSGKRQPSTITGPRSLTKRRKAQEMGIPFCSGYRLSRAGLLAIGSLEKDFGLRKDCRRGMPGQEQADHSASSHLLLSFIGIMENKMETTIVGYIFGIYWDNGKENGN